MFHVISASKYGYIGGSRKLAEQMFDACVRTGRSVCMDQKINGQWVELKEVVA